MDEDAVRTAIGARSDVADLAKNRNNFFYGHVMPNLKRLGMVTPRTEPRYRELGLID